ncbi:winged helix-turn-helix domain-containing protein [Aquabacterium sp.]|uniref:ATP-binding protein n=1 Tax=Aquabacterium sp. TaxID=1872578 RepID=UPI00199B3484|nr:winged helix-turn-helix domain-containing protein [Aquabacterium sp.]MBC7700921.1 helix-turn-helix transcriptional regulator [Aquabacterium sp.]
MSHCYRFDHFELRALERVLYIGGQPANLGARAIDLLLVLVERSGRMVSKSDLLDLVWPGLVVEENNLQVQISALRKVLGQQAISTIPGRGYRFALPMVRDDDSLPSRFTPMASSATDALTQSRPAENVLSVLPSVAGRLWGRDPDLAALHREAHHPLITIAGPGGIGKTAFALAAAHAWCREHRDGAAWVELAGITDPALVPTVVAQAVGLPSDGADPLSSLVAALRPLQLLLVIDNAEHLIDAVARMVQAITAAAPGVRLVVTSQLALKLDNERLFRLNALSVPEPGTALDQAMAHGAIALFADQAQAADRRFALTEANVEEVIALCHRLDGMALAIKLAAARLPLLGLQGVAARLDERFKLLRSQNSLAPPRRQTLMGTLDWSHDLLSPDEQTVFRRLCVFAGGFNLQLASAVAMDDSLDEWAVIELLGALVDRSLVAADGADVPRYRLLESMREFASLKLDTSGEHWLMKRRHVTTVAALMEQAYAAYWRTPDAAWLGTYGPEIDNVRAALDWVMAHEPSLAVDMVGASSPLFLLLGLAPECRRRCLAVESQVLAMPTCAPVARYWLERSRLNWGVSNTLMHDFARRAAEQSRALQDEVGRYLALRCMAGSGVLPPAQAKNLLEEMIGLEKPTWPPRLRLQRQLATVSVLRSGQQLEQAQRVCETLLSHSQANGLDAVVSAALADLAALSLAVGDPDAAVQHCSDIIARGRHRRDNFILHAMAIKATALFMQGDDEQARGALVDFAAASRSRDWEWFGLYSGLFALLAAIEGRHETAARLLGYADHAHQQLGSRDAQVGQAWERASSLVNAVLPLATTSRLACEGAQMAPDAVCHWALARVDV